MGTLCWFGILYHTATEAAE